MDAKQVEDVLRWQQRSLQLFQRLAAPHSHEPMQPKHDLLLLRAAGLASRGCYAEVPETAEQLRRLAPHDRINLYNVACCYALCAAEGDDAEENGNRAVALLQEAVALGWCDAEQTETDLDFDAIREHPGFRELVRRLRQQSPQ